jgi:hypothetical protein
MNGTSIGSDERMRWLPKFCPLSKRNIVALLGIVDGGGWVDVVVAPRTPRDSFRVPRV